MIDTTTLCLAAQKVKSATPHGVFLLLQNKCVLRQAFRAQGNINSLHTRLRDDLLFSTTLDKPNYPTPHGVHNRKKIITSVSHLLVLLNLQTQRFTSRLEPPLTMSWGHSCPLQQLLRAETEYPTRSIQLYETKFRRSDVSFLRSTGREKNTLTFTN